MLARRLLKRSQAIMRAADEWKVDIITMSFGWPRHYPVIEAAIDHATRQEVLFCAAASNNGANDNVVFPANYAPVFCVHSFNEYGSRSQYTPDPQLSSAPNFAVLGENVKAASPGLADGKSQSGTSTATPILAAVMALVLEFVDQKPNKTTHDRRIRTPKGMMEVLLAMSKEKEGYHLVKPWTLMDWEVEKEVIEMRVKDVMDRRFGREE